MNVEWKITGVFKADAQKCYEEIGDTACTPESVLEKARKKNSELHKCFEWNDGIAAEKYRLNQARRLIQLLVVTPKDVSTPVRAFQISSERNKYKPIREFFLDNNEYVALLERAKSELRYIRNRYKSIAELESVFEAIDAL